MNLLEVPFRSLHYRTESSQVTRVHSLIVEGRREIHRYFIDNLFVKLGTTLFSRDHSYVLSLVKIIF